jgi:hypothetical protein
MQASEQTGAMLKSVNQDLQEHKQKVPQRASKLPQRK